MYTGFLKIQLNFAHDAYPVDVAVIRVYHQDGQTFTLYTDASGITPPLELPAPDPQYSLDPTYTGRVYSTCNVGVVMPRFRETIIYGVQIFAGVTVLQEVEMIPKTIDFPGKLPQNTVKQIRIPELDVNAIQTPVDGVEAVVDLTKNSNKVSIDLSNGTQIEDSNVGVLPYIIIPEMITVHLGTPTSGARNVTVPFKHYIKNVCCSEIYSTWPVNTLIANIYCQISLALNRVYTEWYPSKGYNFDITNSTSYDQYYVHERSISENVSELVDNIFNEYIQKIGYAEPYYAEYCNGSTVTCNGLSQWGSKDLGQRGYTPLQILQYYYGNDVVIRSTNRIESIPLSYPGTPLRLSSSGSSVSQMQTQLVRIRRNYPLIPTLNVTGIFDTATQASVIQFQKIFNLAADGVVGKSTWYKISYIYVAVTKLAELTSEGIPDTSNSPAITPLPNPTVQLNNQGSSVILAQFLLNVAADFNDLKHITVDGVFGNTTRAATIDFQNLKALSPDGIIGSQTWRMLYEGYYGAMNSITNINPQFSGTSLRTGSRGNEVSLIQRYLNVVLSFFSIQTVITIDGIFGANTQNAVQQYQALFGLTTDGIVGKMTWLSLGATYARLTAER